VTGAVIINRYRHISGHGHYEAIVVLGMKIEIGVNASPLEMPHRFLGDKRP
jgi:hypothetical protein